MCCATGISLVWKWNGKISSLSKVFYLISAFILNQSEQNLGANSLLYDKAVRGLKLSTPLCLHYVNIPGFFLVSLSKGIFLGHSEVTTWVQIKKDGSPLSLIRRYSPELILIFGENKFPVWKADKGSCQDPNPGLLSVSKRLQLSHWVRVNRGYEGVMAQSFQDWRTGPTFGLRVDVIPHR